MTVTAQNVFRFPPRFLQKRVKFIYLMLVLAAGLLIMTGVFIRYFITGNAPQISVVLPILSPGAPDYQYSILGEGNNMLTKPMDVFVDSGRIYVSDTLNARVQILTQKGELVYTFGKNGNGPGDFSFPYGIVVSPNGEIYVADLYNGNISIFNSAGEFVRYFAEGHKEITQPAGMLIKEQELYVCNLDPGQILVFDMNSGDLLRTIGSNGTSEGELKHPNDLAIGPDGNLYVSDTGNDRIQVFSKSGEFIEILPIDSSLIYSPRGIAFNAFDQLYVVSKLNNQVIIFDKHWKVVEQFGEKVFNLPNGIAFDEKGRKVYVTDHISTLFFQ